MRGVVRRRTTPVPKEPAQTPTRNEIGRVALKRRPSGPVLERRGAERVAAAMPIRLTVPSVRQAVEGQTLNVSHDGMFVATCYPPEAGTVIDIEVQLPNRRLLLHARGEVVHVDSDSDPGGVGIRFLDISYEAQELIDEIVGKAAASGDS